MKCLKCGNENPDDSIFCLYCGNVFLEKGLFSEKTTLTNKVSKVQSKSSITIKDSIVIGGNPLKKGDDLTESNSYMEEAREGIELLSQLKKIKLMEAAEKLRIENEAKIVDAHIKIMKMEAERTGERREGELTALDLAITLNELRDQCVNCEAFAVKVTVEVLKEKVKDEKSLDYLGNICKLLDAVYNDPFRKLEETHKTRVLELCNYIEEAYFASLVHGDKQRVLKKD